MTASRKPRIIVSVQPYVRPDGAKRCKVEVEEGGITQTVALHDLTRPELQRAAAMTFGTIPGNVWLRFKTEQVQDLIRNNDPEAARLAVEAIKGGSVPESAPEPAKVIPQGDKVPQVQAKNPAAQLADLLGQMVGDKGVDLEQVRTIVAEEVEKAADKIRITRVEVKLPDGGRVLPDVHHRDLPKLIAKVAAGVNLFIVGPAGTGKSVAAQQVAEALRRDFYALSFGPTTPTSKLFGYNDANGTFQATPLFSAYDSAGNGGLFLGDELDNGHPGLLAEQNQFLANGHCAFACGMVARHPMFAYVATGNTYGRGGDRLFVGRNQLDAATLDRFVFHHLDIDEDLEEKASLRWSTEESVKDCREWVATVRKVRAEAAAHKLPVVISPRASIDGCKLITTGAFTRTEIIEDVLLKGAGADVRSKLKV